MPPPRRTDLPPHRDPAAWDELIASLNPPAILVLVSSWMGERLQQELTTEDVWQETLAMAWRDRDQHQWKDRGAYRAWLLGIARNWIRNAADAVSAQKRGGGQRIQRLSSVGASGSTGSSDAGRISALLPADSTTPSRIASHEEEAMAMRQALGQLPRELARVVELRLFEELPMKQVAARLGIGLTTAKDRFLDGAERYRSLLTRRPLAP